MTDNSKVSFLRIHRSALLVSVLLVASIAVSIYFGSFKPKATRASIVSSPLEFSIELNKTNFQQGDNIPINLTLRNISNKTRAVAWSSHFLSESKFLPFDVLLTDSNNTYIYQVSKVQGSLESCESRTLEPDTELVATFVWHQWADRGPERPRAGALKGTYYVKADTFGPHRMTIDGV